MAVSGLGNADHALTLYLLAQAKADANKVKFATMGVNLLEALRQGQVDAGLVQEPALTLLQRAGSRVLVNAMDLTDARRYLGGTYEFMGVAVRGKEMAARKDEMVTLTKALADALKALRLMGGPELIAALPKEMTTGLDTKEFGEIIARHRDALYPETLSIDLPAAQRVAQTLVVGGLLKDRGYFRTARHHDCGELVRVRDLTISYGGEPVLEGASIEVGTGQFVSLVGPSGSGKSSLLRAVIGLQEPLAGTVEAGFKPSEIGMLFQDDALLPWKSARDNVALGLTFTGWSGGSRCGRPTSGSTSSGSRVLATASRDISRGGQRKRVAIAQVLAMQPKLLLMDEPFASLDAIVRARIIQDVVGAGRARAHQRAARDPRSGGGDQPVRPRLPALARAARPHHPAIPGADPAPARSGQGARASGLCAAL